MKKKPLLAGSAIAGLFVMVALALPFIVDANKFRSTLEGNLASGLGRKVTIGHLKVALLAGGISVDNISIADDPSWRIMGCGTTPIWWPRSPRSGSV
jgi:hypothetical protein